MSEVPVQVSIIWPDVQNLPVLRANQFLAQLGQGTAGQVEEFVLTMGYVAPPVFLGNPEEQSAAFSALGAIDVRALSRVSMSRASLGGLIELLQRSAEQYDRVTGVVGDE